MRNPLPRLRVAALVSLLSSGAAFAAGPATEARYPIRSEERVHRLGFSFGLEAGSFSRAGATINGAGPGVGISLGISRGLRGEMQLSQAFSSPTSIGVLYTAVRTRLGYALWGSYLSRESRVLIGDASVADTRVVPGPVLGLTAGFDQYFFNGSQVVSPASGGGAGLAYEFPFAGVRWSLKAESGLLFLNGQSAIPRLVSAGVVFLLH